MDTQSSPSITSYRKSTSSSLLCPMIGFGSALLIDFSIATTTTWLGSGHLLLSPLPSPIPVATLLFPPLPQLVGGYVHSNTQFPSHSYVHPPLSRNGQRE